MAIVEDEVRNESEEENEIEVVVEDEDGDQDSADEDSEDDDEEEAMETKVAELERRLSDDPYNYDDHIELIRALWGLSEFDRWRSAFNQLHSISLIQPEHWLMRLQTEVSLAHTQQARDQLAELFEQATMDCYSIPILTEWCSWVLSSGDVTSARAHISEVVRRGGSDPLSGKLFWDAKTELEKSQLDNLSEDDPAYKEQEERVMLSLEQTVCRALLRAEEAWPQFQQVALRCRDTHYVDKVKTEHEAAMEYLKTITVFEDKLLTIEDPDEKIKVYQEYIEVVKDLDKQDKYASCDSDGILKVLYDRATTCAPPSSTLAPHALLTAWAAHAQGCGSRATQWRVLCACARRCPRRGTFHAMMMRHKEREGKGRDEIKTILETALSKGLESYKDTESIWMSYLEYLRRHTAFDDEGQTETLRRTFRLAWDSLAETWGAEANDCEVPLFWARLEYKRLGDPKQGKQIIEEIFKYGENKTMSKYWEAFICLESTRSPPCSEHKLRELHRRALRFVSDYPPTVVRLYTDLERDVGTLESFVQCQKDCEAKLKEWRDSYQAMKDKMIGHKQKGKQPQNKKGKDSKKPEQQQKQTKSDNSKQQQNKSKRKADDDSDVVEVKKKRDGGMQESGEKTGQSSSSGLKRSHEDEESEVADKKRTRTDSPSDPGAGDREACTLFVSNLEFKVNEQHLRDKLSEWGDVVSMRVRAGVKAFGGSICYCQYKKPSSVDKAVTHDREPLDGRPMFLSRYSTNKGKQSFKYSTAAEKNKLFVRNLDYASCTKEALTEVFEKYGTLKDIRIVTFKDGKPKGLAYVEFSEEAGAALALQKCNGLQLGARNIDVAISAPPAKSHEQTLGAPKREPTGGMRRTQLSSFVPSVLQKASTSKANGEDNRPLSNSDFRSLLLKK